MPSPSIASFSRPRKAIWFKLEIGVEPSAPSEGRRWTSPAWWLAMLLAFAVLDERFTLREGMGAGCIVAGVLMLVWKLRRGNQERYAAI